MKETTRLGRNFTFVVAAQLFSQVLTLLISILIARTLGAEQYGVFVFGYAFPGWFLLIASLGLDSVLTMDVAADKSKAGTYLSTISLLRVLLLTVVTALVWTSLSFVLSDPYARTVAMILGTCTVVTTFVGALGATFLAFERMEFIAIVTVVERTFTATLVISLLHFGGGLLLVSLVFLGGSVFSLVVSLVIMKLKVAWFSPKVDFHLMRRIMKKGIPFLLAGVVASLMVTTAPVLLTSFHDAISTGHFNAAYALVGALQAPLSTAGMILFPAMSRMYKEKPQMLPTVIRKTQRLFLTIGIPATFGGFFYAREIVTLLYGNAFNESVTSFEVLIFLVAITASTLGIGSAWAATGRQKLNLHIGSVGATVNVLLCLALIPFWGPLGAAVAFLTANIAIMALTFGMMHRTIAKANLLEILPKPIVAGVVMLFCLYTLPRLSLWEGLIVAPLIYFPSLFLLRGLNRDDLHLIHEAVSGVFAHRQSSEEDKVSHMPESDASGRIKQ